MEIVSHFTVPLPPKESWEILLDIPRIAPCMPGAKLTSASEDGKTFTGEVQVRLGPVLLTFKGKARIVELSQSDWRATVTANGADTKGRGGANAEIIFCLVPTGDETEVQITTQLTLTGSVAQYGRGAGMISDLANHLVGQFADNLRKEIASSQDPALGPAGDSETSGAEAPMAQPPQESRGAAPISGIRLFIWLIGQQLRRLFGGAAR